jgi:hypothetical protein
MDPIVLRLSDCIELFEDNRFSSCFPAQRFARVIIETQDGKRHDSGQFEARWDSVDPPSDRALTEKFRRLVRGVLPAARAEELENLIWRCSELSDAASLLDAMLK